MVRLLVPYSLLLCILRGSSRSMCRHLVPAPSQHTPFPILQCHSVVRQDRTRSCYHSLSSPCQDAAAVSIHPHHLLYAPHSRRWRDLAARPQAYLTVPPGPQLSNTPNHKAESHNWLLLSRARFHPFAAHTCVQEPSVVSIPSSRSLCLSSEHGRVALSSQFLIPSPPTLHLPLTKFC